nr:putative integron gene cassette protein [uncultured bacterium]CAP49080.1 putative integron gene cassette protein [uncultured bacterium]
MSHLTPIPILLRFWSSCQGSMFESFLIAMPSSVVSSTASAIVSDSSTPNPEARRASTRSPVMPLACLREKFHFAVLILSWKSVSAA